MFFVCFASFAGKFIFKMSLLKTYQNPVYPHSFPDPFVLKLRGEYYAYCTGDWRDGKIFGVLRSRDLINWTEIGGAMQRLDNDSPFYWAPEVTYSNGKFYLYYSVGNEAQMELRVAVSERPDGGFVDAGVKLTTEEFAIDAHVFTDENGEKYLFYATDFLTHTHIGTGTVIDKMLDFFTLEGKPRPVTRAKYDWQVYDPQRKEKGGVRWHTIEGSFVLKRKGVYYQMFSGGNWQNITYGVSFATTDDIKRNKEWTQFSDGEKVLPILRTLPDLVVGPGHNSVVRGVNNREIYCVYHRWTENGRVLAIDRQDFAATRMFIEGASFSAKVAPFAPTFADFFAEDNLSENWEENGDWKTSDGEVFNQTTDRSLLICIQTAESFLCEFSLRTIETEDETGGYGFCLLDVTEETFEFRLFPHLHEATAVWRENGEFQTQTFALPDDFDFQAIHLLRVEVNKAKIKIRLDEAALKFEKITAKTSNQIAFLAENMRAAFSGFALTEGFEDLFEWQGFEIEQRGWERLSENGDCLVENGRMTFSHASETDAVIVKGETADDFEFAANIRLIRTFGENSDFGFLLLNQNGEEISRFSIIEKDSVFYLTDGSNSLDVVLPETFHAENFHQFCFLKASEKLHISLEGLSLGEISVAAEKMRIGFFARNAEIALEMVRLTVL